MSIDKNALKRTKQLHKIKRLVCMVKIIQKNKEKMSQSAKGNQNCLGRILSEETKLKI